mmetsp:Transcript_19947/g.56386  ORF Transcript_19947/g.56386 Transcript_19947/m.56386 type:complete len:268 (-) Transcript_19947:74-877(-)
MRVRPAVVPIGYVFKLRGPSSGLRSGVRWRAGEPKSRCRGFGTLSLSSLPQQAPVAVSRLAHVSPEAVFRVLDRDADGAVDLEDLAWAAARGEGWGEAMGEAAMFSAAELQYAFEEADVDGDGRLSREELQGALTSAGLAPWEELPVGLETALLSRLLLGCRRLRRQCRLAAALASLPPEDWRSHPTRKALLRRAAAELSKAVPFVLVAAFMPGSSVIIPAILLRCPALVPTAFRVDPSAPSAAKRDEFQELTARVFGSVAALTLKG